MKIMHGMREVAGQAYYSVKGLRDSGYDAKLILWDESPLHYPYDYCMKMIQGKKYMYPIYGVRVLFNFIKCALKYDTFHFHFGHSLLPKNLDLPFLKLMKKNIFFEFHGSDVRQASIALAMNPLWEKVGLDNEERLRNRMMKLSKYARAFIVHDDELLPNFPEDLKPYIVPLRMDLTRFKPSFPSDDKTSGITIVHAPSHRGVKGTEFIHQAVDKLSKIYDINYILVENMSQNEAFAEYMKADIIVDQLMIGTYGVFAIEAMAMGKPVITYISDFMKTRLPEELPIVSASPDNIESQLEFLIKDANLRNEIGRRGSEYVKKYHDCKKNGRLIGDIYSGKPPKLDGREAFEAVLD